MRPRLYRKAVVWIGLAASVALVISATSHMDYSVSPAKRQGGYAGPKLSLLSAVPAEIVYRDAPCVIGRKFAQLRGQ